jgi:hypothetical protein
MCTPFDPVGLAPRAGTSRIPATGRGTRAREARSQHRVAHREGPAPRRGHEQLRVAPAPVREGGDEVQGHRRLSADHKPGAGVLRRLDPTDGEPRFAGAPDGEHIA